MKIKRAIDDPINRSRYTNRVNKLFYYKFLCDMHRICPEELINPRTPTEKAIFKDFWKVKYHQSIKVEKNRVIIDDHEYLINPTDGFLAEINKSTDNDI